MSKFKLQMPNQLQNLNVKIIWYLKFEYWIDIWNLAFGFFKEVLKINPPFKYSYFEIYLCYYLLSFPQKTKKSACRVF